MDINNIKYKQENKGNHGGRSKDLNKSQRIILTLAIITMFILLIGVTYSWFSNLVDGEGNEIAVHTARLGIIYTDGPELGMTDILPGEVFTKTFKVENTSEETFTYEIYLKDIINTFINDELVFSLKEEKNGELITESPLGKEILLSSIAIDEGETHNYTLTIKFKETGLNQNSNMGALFNGTVQIRESHLIDLEMESVTHNSITVKGLGKNFIDMEGYSFSKDNGVIWTSIQSSDTYTFSGLEYETNYNVKVKGKEKNGYEIESGTLIVRTNEVNAPAVSVNLVNKTYNDITVEIEASDEVVGIKANTYQFSLDNGLTWSSMQSSNEYTFTGLTEDTEYNIKARVENNADKVGTSTNLIVKTDEITLPNVSVILVSKTYSSVTVKIEATDTQTGLKNGTYQFSKDDGVTWTALQENETYTFTGLNANTTYQIKGRVENNGGKKGKSSRIEVRTDEITIPSITVAQTGKTYNSITVKITASDTQTGIKNGTYQFSRDNGETWTVAQSSSTYTFNSLNASTGYQIRGKVENNGGASGVSSTITVTTDTIITPTISLGLVSKTYNSITVKATSSDNQTGIKANTYQFSKDGTNWTSMQESDTYTFTNLITNTTYQLKVRVQNNGGVTGTSPALSTTTDAIITPIISVSTSSKTYNSITVTASASDNQTGIKAGTYQFSKDNGVTWTELQTSNAYIFAGLTPNTGYQIKSRVQNNGGVTGTSPAITSTTDACETPVVTLSVVSKTTTTVTLQAVASDNQSGINPNAYYFGADVGAVWNGGSSWTGATTNTYTFVGLTPGTTYTFAVVAYNYCGGSGAHIISATTDAEFTLASYTGSSSGIYEDETYKYVKFLTSGTVTFNTSGTVDVFLVGGGGAGGLNSNTGRGGGGGYANTWYGLNVSGSFWIEIGAGGSAGDALSPDIYPGGNGGATWFLDSSTYIIGGGFSGSNGGNGGSGGGGNIQSNGAGSGGADGSDGGDNQGVDKFGNPTGIASCCVGQHYSTRAFYTGELYSGGGGGLSTGNYALPGGAGGGGSSGATNMSGVPGAPNTGGGGGAAASPCPGCPAYSGSGGSGIAIIRWLK